MHFPVTVARAFWIAEPGRGEIREERLREPATGEVLVRTLFSGVSRGTESLVFRGLVPESQRAAMRGPFQVGEFPGPVKYGYAAVGVVEAGTAELVDRQVFVLHPHQERFVVPSDVAMPLPRLLPVRRAVLGANMETAVNAIWDAAPMLADRIAVVGGGTVGCLVAYLVARFPAAEVQLVDIDPSREAVARHLGVQGFAAPEDAWEDVDLVFHASGTGAGLATCLRIAANEATIIELSWYGSRAVATPLGADFHARRLVLKSSQVGAVPPAKRGRWSRYRRLALALELLGDERLECLLSGENRFEELPLVMERLAESPGALCQVVHYE